MSKDFYDVLKERRSIYGLCKETVVSDERIEELINFAVKYAPTAFNSQSGRVVVLLNENHNELWDITKETLRKIVPAENFAPTEEKINSFRNGYGTVLFFEDQSVVKGLQDKFTLYKDNFPIWSQQGSGILQFLVWTALDAEGFGVSVQHYNPLIDHQVREKWNVPAEWKLIAQLPFGKPTADPHNKDFLPLEDRIKFYK